MANKKMTFAVCTFKSELSNFAGKAYDEVICVDNFQYLPSRLKYGDKVIVTDICTDFPSLDFMMNFFNFAMKNGITFESVTQCYLNFSAARALPYKITKYLEDMQTFRNQLWSMRRYHGVVDDNSPQAQSYLRECDWLAKRSMSVALATNGILKR